MNIAAMPSTTETRRGLSSDFSAIPGPTTTAVVSRAARPGRVPLPQAIRIIAGMCRAKKATPTRFNCCRYCRSKAEVLDDELRAATLGVEHVNSHPPSAIPGRSERGERGSEARGARRRRERHEVLCEEARSKEQHPGKPGDHCDEPEARGEVRPD
jgi:hypothetical protein